MLGDLFEGGGEGLSIPEHKPGTEFRVEPDPAPFADKKGEIHELIAEATTPRENATPLSPELEAFMSTILQRFDQNKHNLACHTKENREKLELRLRAKPAKLAALKMMEEWGGKPDFTGINDKGEYRLDDLSEESTMERGLTETGAIVSFDASEEELTNRGKALTYPEVLTKIAAIGGGLELMSTDRYLALKELGVKMDLKNYTWLLPSGDRKAEKAAYGQKGMVYHPGASVNINVMCASRIGFRCSLGV
ncbi:DUF4256 domain-containing protein [Candidatus Peregrinibacteria bacterium]|nr:MAG: DUF4256 domain-containing protein [Candidatus Peregrinibacteria bacterium]